MIIVHENLEMEALEIADAFRKVYGLSSRITNEDLGSLFNPIPAFNGFWTSHAEIGEFMRNKYGKKQVMVVTPRDIYGGNKNQDQKIDAPPRLKRRGLNWCSIFGCSTFRPHSKECGFWEERST